MERQAANTIGIYGALTYDVIAAACSSPQTTEINANKRADTLMKWVHLGVAQAAIFTLLGASVERKQGNSIAPPLIGFSLAATMMYASYIHAKQSGLENGGPSTESY